MRQLAKRGGASGRIICAKTRRQEFYLVCDEHINFYYSDQGILTLRTIGMRCKHKSAFSALTLNTHPICVWLLFDAGGSERKIASNALKLDCIVIPNRPAKLYLIIYR